MARLFASASSDYVDLGTGVRGDDLVGIMVACWIKMTTIPVGGQAIAAKWDGGVHSQFELFVDGSGVLNIAVMDSGGGIHVLTGVTVMTTGTWYHVAALFADNSKLRCYVNGAQDATTNPGYTINHNSTESMNTYIGRQSGGAYFDGVVAEYMIGLVNTALASIAIFESTITQMAAGISPTEAWLLVGGSSEFIRYFPLLGDSPEPEMAGHPGHNATVHGTTVVNHPPVRSLSMGLWGSAPKPH